MGSWVSVSGFLLTQFMCMLFCLSDLTFLGCKPTRWCLFIFWDTHMSVYLLVKDLCVCILRITPALYSLLLWFYGLRSGLFSIWFFKASVLFLITRQSKTHGENICDHMDSAYVSFFLFWWLALVKCSCEGCFLAYSWLMLQG